MNKLKSSLHLSKIIRFTIICTIVIALPATAAWVALQERDLEGRYYMSTAFTDKKTGWVVGSALTEDFENPGFIGHTMDGGKTWKKFDIKLEADLTGIYFLDAKHGWAVGQRGIIVNTTNGKDWELQISKVGTWLKSIYFVDKDVGYAVGSNDTIISTSNGGRRWKILQGGQLGEAVGEDDTSLYNAVQFLDKKTGWVAGIQILPSKNTQKALIQKTTNSGKTWVTQETGKEDILEDIFFLNESTGWAVGENGVIIHTTNGGETWKEQISGTEEILRSVRFVDKYTGWAVGGDLGVGAILTTNNGGKKWEVEISKKKMVKVFVLDKKNVWLVSEDGGIFKPE